MNSLTHLYNGQKLHWMSITVNIFDSYFMQHTYWSSCKFQKLILTKASTKLKIFVLHASSLYKMDKVTSLNCTFWLGYSWYPRCVSIVTGETKTHTQRLSLFLSFSDTKFCSDHLYHSGDSHVFFCPTIRWKVFFSLYPLDLFRGPRIGFHELKQI